MLTDGSAAAGVQETVCEPSGQVTMAGLHEPQAQVKGNTTTGPTARGFTLLIWMGMLQVDWQAVPPQEALKTAV